MSTDPFTSSPIHLTQARRRADGSHSSHDLSEAQRRGELLRLRAGIYVDAHDWISAPPWRRYDLSVAATALSRPSTLFCRESALLLHGLPLLRSPAAVLARTRSYNYAGTHPAPPLPGRAGASAFRRRFIAHHPQDPSPTARDLRGVPTKLLEAAIPPGSTRASMRRVVRDEGFSLPEVRLGAASLPGVRGPAEYRVEPLGLALVDTVPRLPFPEAVAVVDAAARRDVDVELWLPHLRTQRHRALWHQAWSFADPLAESPLESEARAVLHQLGFSPPTLQQVVHTARGTYRLDLSWPEQKVALEVDGQIKYFDETLMPGGDARQAHYQEKLRREALEEEGWRIVRVGQAELRNPEALRRRLAAAGILPQ